MNSAVFVVVVAIAVAVIVASPAEPGRVKRLTTFSKPPAESQPPAVGTRECKTSANCTIRGTSCLEDRRDSRYRCLCEDGNPPSSGQCPNRKRVRRGYLPTGNRRPTELPPLFMPVPPPTVSFFPQSATSSPKRHLFRPSSFPLALREKCNKPEDCIPRATCISNATVNRNHKVCLCEAGIEEIDNACGGCERVAEAGSFLIAMGIAAYFLEGRP